MNDDRPIKVHCDEDMRTELQFLVNRRINDLLFSFQKMGNVARNKAKPIYDKEIQTLKLLQHELNQAGT